MVLSLSVSHSFSVMCAMHVAVGMSVADVYW